MADASAKKAGKGYLLKFVITNVLTSEIVESKTTPCRQCDLFAVVDMFKKIGQGTSSANNNSAITMLGGSTNNAAISKPTDAPTIFIFDSKPSGAEVNINGHVVGRTPYQGLSHKVGQVLKVTLKKAYYKPLSFNANLDRELVRLNDPIVMEQGLGQAIVSLSPYPSGVELCESMGSVTNEKHSHNVNETHLSPTLIHYDHDRAS